MTDSDRVSRNLYRNRNCKAALRISTACILYHEDTYVTQRGNVPTNKFNLNCLQT